MGNRNARQRLYTPGGVIAAPGAGAVAPVAYGPPPPYYGGGNMALGPAPQPYMTSPQPMMMAAPPPQIFVAPPQQMPVQTGGGGGGVLGGPNQWTRSDFSRAYSENVSQQPFMQQQPATMLSSAPPIVPLSYQTPPCPPMPPMPPCPPCQPCNVPAAPMPPMQTQTMTAPPFQTYSSNFPQQQQQQQHPFYVQWSTVPFNELQQQQTLPPMNQPIAYPPPVNRSFTLDYGRASYVPGPSSWMAANRYNNRF